MSTCINVRILKNLYRSVKLIFVTFLSRSTTWMWHPKDPLLFIASGYLRWIIKLMEGEPEGGRIQFINVITDGCLEQEYASLLFGVVSTILVRCRCTNYITNHVIYIRISLIHTHIYGEGTYLRYDRQLLSAFSMLARWLSQPVKRRPLPPEGTSLPYKFIVVYMFQAALNQRR